MSAIFRPKLTELKTEEFLTVSKYKTLKEHKKFKEKIPKI